MSGIEIPASKSKKVGVFTIHELEDGTTCAEVKFS